MASKRTRVPERWRTAVDAFVLGSQMRVVFITEAFGLRGIVLLQSRTGLTGKRAAVPEIGERTGDALALRCLIGVITDASTLS